MKTYNYKGYKFRQTDVLCTNNNRYLYEIVGLKEAGKYPFLTTIKECKEYIEMEVEQNEKDNIDNIEKRMFD
jgi:hypothetical protein